MCLSCVLPLFNAAARGLAVNVGHCVESIIGEVFRKCRTHRFLVILLTPLDIAGVR